MQAVQTHTMPLSSTSVAKIWEDFFPTLCLSSLRLLYKWSNGELNEFLLWYDAVVPAFLY